MPITAPLARDQKGEQFDLPDKAAEWRVRIYTGGRPTDYELPNGETLFVPIMASDETLIDHGCTGQLSLLAVDAQRKSVAATPAYVDLGAPVAKDETSRNGKSEHDAPVDALVQVAIAMQRTQMERERALAARERANTDLQIATVHALRDMTLGLADKVRPVDAQTLVKEHSAIQKLVDRQRNGGEIAVEVAGDAPPDGKQPPKWLTIAAQASTIAEQWVIPTLKKPEHVEWVRMIAGLASQVASFMGVGAPNGSAQPGEVINGTATVTPQVQRTISAMPQVVADIIGEMEDTEGEALFQYVSRLNEGQFAVFVSKVVGIGDLAGRVVWARNRMKAAQAGAGNGTQAKSDAPSRGPLETAPILTATLAELTADERRDVEAEIRDYVRPEIEAIEAKLSNTAPEKRATALREAIAKERAAEKNADPGGGGEEP